VFTAEVVQVAANSMTWAEMNFGMTLRDRVGLVIDELYWYPAKAMIGEMTTTGDYFAAAISQSDSPASLSIDDRRIISIQEWVRLDFGTAAGGQLVHLPKKLSFAPPLITLPNRLFIGLVSAGLASAGTMRLRMHFRTVPISEARQLMEILEAFQLST